MSGCSAQPGRALTERTRAESWSVSRSVSGSGTPGAGRRPSMTCHSRLGFKRLPSSTRRTIVWISRTTGPGGASRPWPLRAPGPGWCGPWCAWSGHSTRDRRRAAGASGQVVHVPGLLVAGRVRAHLAALLATSTAIQSVVHLGASVPCKDSAAHWSACVGSRGQPGSGAAVTAEVSRNALISDTRPFEPPRSAPWLVAASSAAPKP